MRYYLCTAYEKRRAENVKKRHYLYKYSDTAKQVIEALLNKYANDGIKEIEDTKVLQLKEFARIQLIKKVD